MVHPNHPSIDTATLSLKVAAASESECVSVLGRATNRSPTKGLNILAGEPGDWPGHLCAHIFNGIGPVRQGSIAQIILQVFLRNKCVWLEMQGWEHFRLPSLNDRFYLLGANSHM